MVMIKKNNYIFFFLFVLFISIQAHAQQEYDFFNFSDKEKNVDLSWRYERTNSGINNADLYNKIQQAAREAEARARKQQQAAQAEALRRQKIAQANALRQQRANDIKKHNQAVREYNAAIEAENRRIQEERRKEEEEKRRIEKAQRWNSTFNNEMARTEGQYNQYRRDVYSLAKGESHDAVDAALSVDDIIANEMNKELSKVASQPSRDVKIGDIKSAILQRRAAKADAQTQRDEDLEYFREHQRLMQKFCVTALTRSSVTSRRVKPIIAPLHLPDSYNQKAGILWDDSIETVGYIVDGFIKDSGKRLVEGHLENSYSPVGIIAKKGWNIYKKAKDAIDVGKVEVGIVNKSLMAIKKTVATGDPRYTDEAFAYAFRQTGGLAADKVGVEAYFDEQSTTGTFAKWWTKSLFYKKEK